jgi:hypothetical protein
MLRYQISERHVQLLLREVMVMRQPLSIQIRVALALVALLLAISRWVFFETVHERMDAVFLVLLASVPLIFIIPWEQLTTINLGGVVELTLRSPQVVGALESLSLNRVEDDRLRATLSSLQDEIKVARGGRVLWVDDKPHDIIGERRLLRALGVNVITAISSEDAEKTLREDNDFDLMITDVQRRGRATSPSPEVREFMRERIS